MKKIYLHIVFGLLSVSLFAQDYTITPNNSLTTTIQTNEYVTATISFNNTSSDAITFVWDLAEKIAPAGWDYSYCDYNTCYDGTFTHGVMAPVTPGNSGFIKVNVMTINEGWGYYKFVVYNQQTPEVTDTIEFWFNGIAGVKQILKEEIALYPNPVNAGDNWTIKNVPVNSVIEIYNSLGQKVIKTNSSSGGNLTIDDKLNKGAYIVRISHDGIIENRKLIIR